MNTILCGQFDDFESAEHVATDLQMHGLCAEDIQSFALNAPGQHDRYPLGGDEDSDRGARRGGGGARGGAALGGAAGLAIGAAMLPVVGPLAAVVGLGIGAYTGSLAGAVNSMGPDAEISGPENVPRPAGVRVAVNVAEPKLRAEIIATFNRHHAKSIEEAEGTWREGAWADFDPIGAPRWVQKPAE